MKAIFHWLCRIFKRKHAPSAAYIEKKLTPEALLALKAEAEFLRNQHGVSVEPLAKGEQSTSPKAVDSAIETQLIAQCEEPPPGV